MNRSARSVLVGLAAAVSASAVGVAINIATDVQGNVLAWAAVGTFTVLTGAVSGLVDGGRAGGDPMAAVILSVACEVRADGSASLEVKVRDRAAEPLLPHLPAFLPTGLAPSPAPQPTPERATPERATPERATPDRATPEPPTPGRATPQRTTPGRATPQRATPERAVPERPAPRRVMPGRPAPERAVPEREVLNGVLPVPLPVALVTRGRTTGIARRLTVVRDQCAGLTGLDLRVCASDSAELRRAAIRDAPVLFLDDRCAAAGPWPLVGGLDLTDLRGPDGSGLRARVVVLGCADGAAAGHTGALRRSLDRPAAFLACSGAVPAGHSAVLYPLVLARLSVLAGEPAEEGDLQGALEAALGSARRDHPQLDWTRWAASVLLPGSGVT